MADDKRLETMQDEIKLLKGELKQSLASVRDYLLNMELPSSEFSTILAALGGEGDQKVTMKGAFTNPQDDTAVTEPKDELAETLPEGAAEETVEEESETPPEDEDLLNMEEPQADESEATTEEGALGQEGELPPEEQVLSEGMPGEEGEFMEEAEGAEGATALDEEGVLSEEEGPFDEQDETAATDSESPIEEEQPMEYDRITAEASSATPKVNMLANLITWVARAKKEIGFDQMPIFLEVYGISGHLSPELKELVLHLAELTAERPEAMNNAEVWSQSMLTLHGILTGGDAPLHPLMPFWTTAVSEEQPAEEEIIEVDKAKEAPVKLKLVFPNSDGKNKEFCIDLNPEADSEKPSSARRK